MSIDVRELLDIADYAGGALDLCGIELTRLDDGAMTTWGVSVPVVRMEVLGSDENGDPASIVAYMTRDQLSELANEMASVLLDG